MDASFGAFCVLTLSDLASRSAFETVGTLGKSFNALVKLLNLQ